jgi:uncharacterized cupredoxin-like copper-binding protein
VRRTLLTLVAVLATAMLLAACGNGVAETTTNIQVTGTDNLRFDPDSFSVPAGQQVTVELTAEASVEHDFVIEETGDELVVHADPGETATGTFTIDEPGSYTVYCSVPGHREAGMVADLEVVEE